MARRTRRMSGGRKRRTGGRKMRGGHAHGLIAQLYKAAPALALAAMLTRKRGNKSGGTRRRRRSRGSRGRQ